MWGGILYECMYVVVDAVDVEILLSHNKYAIFFFRMVDFAIH